MSQAGGGESQTEHQIAVKQLPYVVRSAIVEARRNDGRARSLAGHPAKPFFADFGYLGGGGAFGAELTAAPAKVRINQMAGATCTWRLMYSRMDVNGT